MKRIRVTRVLVVLLILAVILCAGVFAYHEFTKNKQPDEPSIVIKLKKEKVTITLEDEYQPKDNIDTVVDADIRSLPYSEKEQKGCYSIIDTIDNQKEGTYQVEVIALDDQGNITKKTFQVVVEKGNESSDDNVNKVKENGVPYYVNGVLLVNKHHGLPKDYGEVDAEAYGSLEKLQAAANTAGFDIPYISGFRTYEQQVELYNAYIERDGQEAADTYSARPGYSEHQSGLCFDIGAIDNDYGETEAGKWLAANAHRFGFIIRYPEGKEDITGYMYEPWHVRYVGVDIATTIYEHKETLEEYLNVR